MENLIQKSNFTTPDIRFDAETGELFFGGASFPENVPSFYAPLFNWIHEYLDSRPSKVEMVFKMEYINTASIKTLFQLFIILAKFDPENAVVIVKWYYASDDEDMLETGEHFQSESGLRFEMIPE